MAEQTKPRRLSAGARIGIVSPAFWLEPERLQRAVGVFEGLGYELVLGKSTRLKENQYAGSAKDRAADIMAMFKDSSIDAVICARGGTAPGSRAGFDHWRGGTGRPHKIYSTDAS